VIVCVCVYVFFPKNLGSSASPGQTVFLPRQHLGSTSAGSSAGVHNCVHNGRVLYKTGVALSPAQLLAIVVIVAAAWFHLAGTLRGRKALRELLYNIEPVLYKTWVALSS